jgi:serine phosphatase RsbU (regulator of sigma subunit)
LIEDSRTAARLVEIYLRKRLDVPYSLEHKDRLSEGLRRITVGKADLVLLDLNLPDSSGMETFQRVLEVGDSAPVVIVSSEDEESLAVTAVRQGAEDYLVKGRFDEESLARAVRFAVERARRKKAEKALQLTEEQLFIARSVQQNLFPRQPLESPIIDIWGRCEPADEVGGDYFDYVPLLNEHLGVIVADISGHGIRAAFAMVAFRAVIHSLTTIYQDLGHLVSLAQRIMRGDLREDEFVTTIFVQIDPQTRLLKYVGAGHPGYLFSPRGELKQVFQSRSPPIGVVEDLMYSVSSPVTFEQGDLLVLCTDGVTERRAPDRSIFGEDRLFDVIKSCCDMTPQQITEMVFHDVVEFAQGQPQLDDITVVVGRLR